LTPPCFDHRRDLIVHEANAIGTTATAGLVPPICDGACGRLQQRRRQRQGVSLLRAQPETARRHLEAAREAGTFNLVIPSLNDTLDTTTTRKAAAQTHPPIAIFLTLK
jgi:hypothetical protein